MILEHKVQQEHKELQANKVILEHKEPKGQVVIILLVMVLI